MDFKKNTRPIYLQIADNICDAILSGTHAPGSRIPSVREYAASVAVNPNTVMRTYEHLSQQGVILNRRGIGYFVTDDALSVIRNAREKSFLGSELPEVFRRLSLQGMTPEELADSYREYLANNHYHEIP